MPRPRGFDELAAVRAAAAVFVHRGYEGTSVDDLVAATEVHRGSLYRVFGSKLGLFHRALDDAVEQQVLPWAHGLGQDEDAVPPAGLDLVLVAALERAGQDPTSRAGVARSVAAISAALGATGPDGADGAAAVLGRRLLTLAGLDRPNDDDRHHDDDEEASTWPR